jgi:hypothetical protein
MPGMWKEMPVYYVAYGIRYQTQYDRQVNIFEQTLIGKLVGGAVTDVAVHEAHEYKAHQIYTRPQHRFHALKILFDYAPRYDRTFVKT